MINAHKSYCIIIVEEDESVYRKIVSALEKTGGQHHVRRVTRQEDLDDELVELAPDFVICDHSRSPWNSFAVLEQVRAFQPTMPFAVIGGDLDDGLHASLKANGVDTCVDDSRLSELLPAVEGMLHRHEERQRLCVEEIRRNLTHDEPASPQAHRRILRFRTG